MATHMIINKIAATRKKIKRLQVRVFLLLVSLTISLTTFTYFTYSWFLYQRTFNMGFDGIDVNSSFSVSHEIYKNDVRVYSNELAFDPLYPGHINRQKISIISHNFREDVYMSWRLSSPLSNQEIPYIDTLGAFGPVGDYYYLGSQIQVEEINITVNNLPASPTTGAGLFLVATNSLGVSKGQVNGVSNPIATIPELLLIDGLLLPSNTTSIIDIYFTFVDNGTNQNVYQAASPARSFSSRNMTVYYWN